MDNVSPWIAAWLGMFAGIVVFGAVNRWVMSVYLAATGHDSMRRNALPVPPDQRTSVLPIVLLHSGFWILLGALGATFYVLSHPHQPSWHWFFAAAYTVPVLIYGVAFAALFARRRKAQPPSNAA